MMKIIHAEDFATYHRRDTSLPLVLGLGVFDGVHLGHQSILQRVCDHARALGGVAGVFTFENHPFRVLYPQRCPLLIQSLHHRLARIEQIGIELAIVPRFTTVLAHTPPEQFFRTILVDQLRITGLVVGENFRFGVDAQGDSRVLSHFGKKYRVQVSISPSVYWDNEPVSSTRVRMALAKADVQLAHGMLGTPYQITGVVAHGAGRGKALGFPTANIHPDMPVLLPDGVYWGLVHCQQLGARPRPAMVYYGTRPTLPDQAGTLPAVEVNVLDYDGDLYGVSMAVEILDYARASHRYDTLQALREQLLVDQQRCQKFFRSMSSSKEEKGSN